MAPSQPPQDAVDCVAYLNEAWTPYHSVLASCKQLMAAGFQVLLIILHILNFSLPFPPQKKMGAFSLFFVKEVNEVC